MTSNYLTPECQHLFHLWIGVTFFRNNKGHKITMSSFGITNTNSINTFTSNLKRGLEDASPHPVWSLILWENFLLAQSSGPPQKTHKNCKTKDWACDGILQLKQSQDILLTKIICSPYIFYLQFATTWWCGNLKTKIRK